MEDVLKQILIAGTGLSIFIVAATAMIKPFVKDNKFLPIVNMLIGIVIGVVWAISFDKSHLVFYLWGGVAAGWNASGIFDFGVNVKALFNQSQSNKLIDEGNGKQDNREDGE